MSAPDNVRTPSSRYEAALTRARNEPIPRGTPTAFQQRVLDAFPLELRDRLRILRADDGVEYVSEFLWVQFVSAYADKIDGVMLRWFSAGARLDYDRQARYVVVLFDANDPALTTPEPAKGLNRAEVIRLIRRISADVWEVSRLEPAVECIEMLEAIYAQNAPSLEVPDEPPAQPPTQPARVEPARIEPIPAYTPQDPDNEMVVDEPFFDEATRDATLAKQITPIPLKQLSLEAQARSHFDPNSPKHKPKKPRSKATKKEEEQAVDEADKKPNAIEAYEAGLTAQEYFSLMVRNSSKPEDEPKDAASGSPSDSTSDSTPDAPSDPTPDDPA